MTGVEPPGPVGALRLLRWGEPALPAGLEDLVAEAERDGIPWLADLPGEWERRPFIGAGEALLLAMRDQAPVGLAVICADPHVDDGHTGRLRFIYVARGERGQGLLRRFIETALGIGRGRWRRLRLHTDNPAAARVYEDYGFVPTGAEPRSTHLLDGL